MRYYGVDMRDILDRVADTELDELRDYVETVEHGFAAKLTSLGQRIEARAQGKSADVRERIFEGVEEDVHFLTQRFPELARRTAFVYLYSLLEHALLNLCKHVQQFGRFNESVTESSHKGIVRAQRYLKDIAKVEFPDGGGDDWQEIVLMGKIRHVFVHRIGRIKERDPSPDLLAYIKRKKDLIEVDGMGEIALRTGFCQDAIEVVRRFYKAVLQAVPDKLLRKTDDEE